MSDTTPPLVVRIPDESAVTLPKVKKTRKRRNATPKSLNAPKTRKRAPRPITEDDKQSVVKIGPGVTIDWS
jgi:hypothetical protein